MSINATHLTDEEKEFARPLVRHYVEQANVRGGDPHFAHYNRVILERVKPADTLFVDPRGNGYPPLVKRELRVLDDDGNVRMRDDLSGRGALVPVTVAELLDEIVRASHAPMRPDSLAWRFWNGRTDTEAAS